MMASFLLHWSLEFLLENWTYVKENCIAKIASQNSIFQLLNNVKTARERFYDLQKGRILPENYEPLRQDVKKRRGRYRVIHMTRAANKALGHNRINLSEGLKQLQKSLENIKLEETSRTLKLENQGWKKTSSISEVDPMRVGILWITVTSWNLKKAPKLKIVGGFFFVQLKKLLLQRKVTPFLRIVKQSKSGESRRFQRKEGNSLHY